MTGTAAAPVRWDRIAVAGIALTLVLLPTPAFAQSNIEGMANTILDLLTGPLARVLATIALVVVGFLFFTGRGSMQALVTVIIGCFIVFSARWLIGLIAT